jgi:hypothetical protein
VPSTHHENLESTAIEMWTDNWSMPQFFERKGGRVQEVEKEASV